MQVNEVRHQRYATGSTLELLRETTTQDGECVSLKHSVQKGWPRTILKVASEISEDGLTLNRTKIFISTSSRQDILTHPHTGHLGVARHLHQGKQTVYWLRLYNEQQSLVKTVRCCLPSSKLVRKYPLLHHLSAKFSVINTLKHRAKTVCSNNHLLKEEEDHFIKALKGCKYPE